MKSWKESSACCAVSATRCSSSPSPLRKRSTLACAFCWKVSTFETASAKADLNSVPPEPAGDGTAIAGMDALTGRIGMAISLLHEVQRVADHVFRRGHRRNVGLIGAGRAKQVHHLLGRIHAGESDVAIGVGVGMAGHVAPLGFPVIDNDLRDR